MIPAYLYQYTSMNSVLAILENKTIRFTRLDSLNDLNEGCCGEYAHLKKYVYISSWSADERESIPMWSLYGRDKKENVLDQGVRIKVPTNLFTFDGNGGLKEELALNKVLNNWNVVTEVKTKDIELGEDVKEKLKDADLNDYHFTRKEVVGPVKVDYISFANYADRYSGILKPGQHPGFYSFFPKDVGYEKVDDWAYENEYRFWMQYPYCKQIYGSGGVLKNDVSFTKYPYIDVFYNEKAIPEMEIMLAPNFNVSLVETFKSELEKRGFLKVLQKSALDVRM